MHLAVKRAILRALVTLADNPQYRMRLEELRPVDIAELTVVAARMGVDPKTLTAQLASGLDNPVYRYKRDAGLYDFLRAHSKELQGCSWLDVGAGTGSVSVYLSEMLKSQSFVLCDVEIAPRTNFPVQRFDGTTLGYPDNAFDFVLFSYVLHHAGDRAISLLRHAYRMARRYVIVAEDPKETDVDSHWAYRDDRRGTFRGLAEWRELFALLRFTMVHEAALDSVVHSRHLFVLAPDKT